MMSTYEIVVALFSTSSSSSPSTIEVTTVQTKKVLVNEPDSEANASNSLEV
jgi:hypothetical protein